MLQNYIEQILQNSNKKTPENKNIYLKNQLFTIIDRMFKDSENWGCFCYFITSKINENEIRDVVEIIDNIQDIAFYNIAIESASDGILHTHIFLAIRNLIGNNSRIENNIRGLFFGYNFMDTSVIECEILDDKVKMFQYGIKDIFVSETQAIFFYDRHWFLVLSPFLKFISENPLGILTRQIQAQANELEYISLEHNKNSKNLTLNNLNNLFRLYFAEKKWYINEYNIYASIPNMHMSIKYVKNVKQIAELYEDIITWMLYKHYITFFNFDFVSLKLQYLEILNDRFLDAPATIVQTIKISFDIIEFKNGLYFIETNQFLQIPTVISTADKPTIEILNILHNKHVKTLNYYFRRSKCKTPPVHWMKLIEKKIIAPIVIPSLFRDFTKYFHDILLEESKKQTLICDDLRALKKMLFTEWLTTYFSSYKNKGIISNVENVASFGLCRVSTGEDIRALLKFIFENNAISEDANIEKVLRQLYDEFIDIVIFCHKLGRKKNIQLLLEKLKISY